MRTTSATLFTRRRLLAGGVGIAALGASVGRGLNEPGTRRVAAKGRDRLYALTGSVEWALTPLDGETLADDAAEPAIALGVGASGPVVASGDGMALAYSRGPDTAVLDRATGRERLIALAEQSWPVALSAGGLRVVTNVRDRTAMGVAPMRWVVVGVETGAVEVEVEGSDDGWHPAIVDDGAVRLYRLTPESGGQAGGPWPVSVVAHDLIHGAEIGRAELPGLLAGIWGTGRTWESGGYVEQIMSYQIPGLALSPDGRRLAVVHPAGDVVTTIDARTCAIERSLPIAAKRSALDRLVGLLPLVPQGAAAKAEEGSLREAVFGADGQSLYVWGTESRAEETLSREGVGLRRIDVATGEIEATGLGQQEVARVLPLNDGLYVASWDPGFALRRLDPSSLDVQAERRFGEWQGLLSVRR